MKTHEDHGHDLNVKKVDRLSGTKVRLTLEYSSDTVTKHEKMTANRYLQIAKIPGFRPGKAPLKMVTDKYKEDILKDVVQHLVESGLAEAIEKTKLSPVNRPRLSKISERMFGDNKPLEFQAEFEVQPEIELRNYKGLPLKHEETKVDEEEVGKTLENIRDRMAVLEPFEAPKAEKGVFAVLEVGYDVAGDKPVSEKLRTVTVEVGAGRLFPELEAALLELPVGGELKDIDVTFPADHDDKSVAGKKAVFHCRILELKKKMLPPMDDAFAGQIRPGGTLESLKKEIRENILSSKQEEAKRAQRNQVVEFLVANNQFEVPSSLVDRQTINMLQWMAEDMQKRGMKPELPSKEEDLKAIRSRAEQMVRSSLLLKEVALKEKIELDETRLRARVEQMADQLKKSTEETEKLLEGQGMLERLRDEVLTDQVFDFLIGNATRVAGSPQA